MNDDEATCAMVDALNQAGIPHMLVGSLSANFYAVPRSTHDADFVIELAGHSLGELKELLDAEFKIDPQMSFETTTGTYRNIVTLASSPFTIELFRLGVDAYDQERFSRRRSVEFKNRTTFVASMEDVIVTKLRWERAKDLEDIRKIIIVQQDGIDWEYVYRWCDEHGTRAALDKIRASVPPEDG